MRITIANNRMFVEHRSGVVNAYDHRDLELHRDAMVQELGEKQKEIDDIDAIIDKIKPVVIESFLGESET